MNVLQVNSLQARVLWLAAVLLVVFVGGTGFILQRGVADVAQAGVQNRQMGVVYGLLAVAEFEPAHGFSVTRLPDPRLAQPGSGLYARVIARSGEVLWRSPSLEGVGLSAPGAQPSPGQMNFSHQSPLDYFQLDYGVLWEVPGGEAHYLQLQVVQDSGAYEQSMAEFRHTLAVGLGVLGLSLLLLQTLVLRWGLAPLRRVTNAVARVERGEQSEVSGHYPSELATLADNLNRLIRSDRARFERQRNALADLSHSLKTPLSVLAGAVDVDSGENLVDTVKVQSARMDAIVQHQLRRATSVGQGIGRVVSLAPAVARVVSALGTVYADKSVQCQSQVDSSLQFPGDEGDLMELLGNLLDNAFKCCKTKVRVTASEDAQLFSLVVEDDGPGIPASERGLVANRGVRLDELRPGSGIGLAVVTEIVKAYKGQLEIGESLLGGARMHLTIALRGAE